MNGERACEACGETSPADIPLCIWCGWRDPRIHRPATDGSK